MALREIFAGFFSVAGYEVPYLESQKNAFPFKVSFHKEALNKQSAALAVGYEVVSVFTGDDCGADVLNALYQNGTRLLVTRSVGYDHIDLNVCKNLGISVAHIPEYSPYAVAEHAVAMAMALNRKLILANYNFKKSDYRLNGLTGFDMHGKTVGILGVGRIGIVLARILHGFGCKLLGYDVNPRPYPHEMFGMQYASLDEVMKASDILFITLPLNADTRYIINKNTLNYMKKGAMLINVGRGPLVNTEALIEALHAGLLSAVGLDGYEDGKGLYFYDHSGKPDTDPLLTQLKEMKNVLLTAHQAFLTQEALTGIANGTFEAIQLYLSEAPENPYSL